MTEANRLLLEILRGVVVASEASGSTVRHFEALKAHLEAEGAPGPVADWPEWKRRGSGVLRELASPPVQSAPPGFRVVGRSGPGVACLSAAWLRLRISDDEPRQFRIISERLWNAGCYDILVPLTTASGASSQTSTIRCSVIAVPSSPGWRDEVQCYLNEGHTEYHRFEPIDQPAAPPTSGAGDTAFTESFLQRLSDEENDSHGQPAPQPSGNPGELPAKCGAVDDVCPERYRCALDAGHGRMHKVSFSGGWHEWSDPPPEPQQELEVELNRAREEYRDVSDIAVAKHRYAATWKALAKRYRAQRASAWRTVDRNLERSVELANVVANLRVEIADLKRAAPVQCDGCPCLVIGGCSPVCTCVSPIYSGGCSRCAKYGDDNQRRLAAEAIARAIDQARPSQPAPVDVIRGSDGAVGGLTRRRVKTAVRLARPEIRDAITAVNIRCSLGSDGWRRGGIVAPWEHAWRERAASCVVQGRFIGATMLATSQTARPVKLTQWKWACSQPRRRPRSGRARRRGRRSEAARKHTARRSISGKRREASPGNRLLHGERMQSVQGRRKAGVHEGLLCPSRHPADASEKGGTKP